MFANGTNDIANDDERIAIRQAFQLWADYGNLNFTEVTSNADIEISWQVGVHGDGVPFNGVNGVLAHAFFPPPNGSGTIAGDIHFDDDETWTLAERPIPSGQPIDLVTVAAHEIGHALGLDHSNVACALMNPFYNGSHRYLSQLAVWQYGGATNIFSTFCSLFSFSSNRRITPSCSSYHQLLYLFSAAVTGRRFSNTATSPSRNRNRFV